MILGAEIGMLVFSIYVLITGKMKLSNTKYVYGGTARLVAIIGLLPLPLAFLAGVVLALARFDAQQNWGTVTLLEAGILVGCLMLFYGIGLAVAEPPRPESRSRRQPTGDEDDYDDRPRRRRRDDEYDEDEDDRPRRRRADDRDY